MVKVIRPGDRDPGTAQTPGMRREAGISAGTAGSEGLWMGTAVNAAGASSSAHHHGANESGIYILQGPALLPWGEVPVCATLVTNLAVEHRFGQTFVVWSTPQGADWRYRIYRGTAPLTNAATLDAASLVGTVGDSTWKDRRLSQLRGQTFAFRLDSLAAELTPSQAVCVITPAADRVSFYAVTAQLGAGAEDRTVIPGTNAQLTSVTECVALTRPVFQLTLTNRKLPF